jgi:hypothetical protein
MYICILPTSYAATTTRSKLALPPLHNSWCGFSSNLWNAWSNIFEDNRSLIDINCHLMTTILTYIHAHELRTELYFSLCCWKKCLPSLQSRLSISWRKIGWVTRVPQRHLCGMGWTVAIQYPDLKESQVCKFKRFSLVNIRDQSAYNESILALSKPLCFSTETCHLAVWVVIYHLISPISKRSNTCKYHVLHHYHNEFC